MKRVIALAVPDEDDDRLIRILDVHGKEIKLEALVPKEHLEEEQRQRLTYLLAEYRILMIGKVGRMRMEPCVLPVMKEIPAHAQAPFPIPRCYHEATFREVYRLVQLGVLEVDKDSPYVSPAFVIPKKDGSVRLLTDFRWLNKYLIRHYYPLPKILDLIRELPKPGYFTALDLVMGYYSREIALQSRKYTAIVLPWGKYRYCRLPMGISTAPDEFQAVMNSILGGLPFVRVYLDDVLIISSSFNEHMEHLRMVMERLREAGVVVHPQKSNSLYERWTTLAIVFLRMGLNQ